MTEKTDGVRAWLAPGIIITLLAYGGGSLSWVNNVSNTATSAKEHIVELKAKVGAIEAANSTSGARLAVVESQLTTVLKLVERIDARMEAGRGG